MRFSTLNADSGYWKVEISKGDPDMTVFTSHHRLSGSTQMAFGLKIATVTFESGMNIYFMEVKWHFAVV